MATRVQGAHAEGQRPFQQEHQLAGEPVRAGCAGLPGQAADPAQHARSVLGNPQVLGAAGAGLGGSLQERGAPVILGMPVPEQCIKHCRQTVFDDSVDSHAAQTISTKQVRRCPQDAIPDAAARDVIHLPTLPCRVVRRSPPLRPLPLWNAVHCVRGHRMKLGLRTWP